MSGRRICVTGSTRGIGLAIAEAFARQGAHLVINAETPDDGGAADRLSALTECHYVPADLSTADGARQLVAAASERLGGLDTLVCNAGSFFDTHFDDLTVEAVDRTFDLNVKGYLYCAQAFARDVSERTDPSIVLIGSSNSLAAEVNSVAYDASKGAVLMLIRSLAVTLAARGIRVNGVGPGLVETPLTQAGIDAPGVRSQLDRQIPLCRVGQPDDIGGAVLFLTSPAARYITGQMLYVDGGILAQQMSWGNPS
ncbi:MAG: SDR family oxidoreductase [Rhodobacteraceae bacterium]|nr:SDR family oxidoreductase [Paracoccaceae bacterium]